MKTKFSVTCAERFNRILLRMMKAYLRGSHTDWGKIIIIISICDYLLIFK